jgi:hypothetical protein
MYQGTKEGSWMDKWSWNWANSLTVNEWMNEWRWRRWWRWWYTHMCVGVHTNSPVQYYISLISLWQPKTFSGSSHGYCLSITMPACGILCTSHGKKISKNRIKFVDMWFPFGRTDFSVITQTVNHWVPCGI